MKNKNIISEVTIKLNKIKCNAKIKNYTSKNWYHTIDEGIFNDKPSNKYDKEFITCDDGKHFFYKEKVQSKSEEDKKTTDGEICFLEGDKVWLYKKTGNKWFATKQSGGNWFDISNRPDAVRKLESGCKTTPKSDGGVSTAIVIEDPESRKKYWDDLISEGGIYDQGIQHTLTTKEVVYIIKVDKTGNKQPLTNLSNLELDKFDYIVLYPTKTNKGDIGKIQSTTTDGQTKYQIVKESGSSWSPEEKQEIINMTESIRKVLNKKLQEQKINRPNVGGEMTKNDVSGKTPTKSKGSEPMNDLLTLFGLNKENGIEDPKGILSGETANIQKLIDNGARSDWFYEWNQLLNNYNITTLLQLIKKDKTKEDNTKKDNTKEDINGTNEYLINSPLPSSDDFNQYNQKTFGGIIKTKSNLPIFIIRGREEYKSTETAKTNPESCKRALIEYLKDGLQKRSSVSEGNKCFICNCNSSGSFDEYKKMLGTKITIGGNQSEFGITPGETVSSSLSPYRWLFNKKLNWKEIVSIIRGESFKTTQGKESRIKSDFIISKFDDPNYDSCLRMGCSSEINESLIEKVKKRMVEAIIDKKILKENMVKSITKGLIK